MDEEEVDEDEDEDQPKKKGKTKKDASCFPCSSSSKRRAARLAVNIAENGSFSFSNGSQLPSDLVKIETNGNGHEKKNKNEVCHDDSSLPVKAQTLDKLHSLQKKRIAPITPIQGAIQGPFQIMSEEERQTQQLKSISASLASLTRETGPKVVGGDSAKKVESPRASPAKDPFVAPSKVTTSDSALKFTHVLYNLSPTELYKQAIKLEKGSFITSTGAFATLSGAKTGHSPRDKRVVKDETTENGLWWGKGSPNIEMDEHTFLVNRERAVGPRHACS